MRIFILGALACFLLALIAIAWQWRANQAFLRTPLRIDQPLNYVVQPNQGLRSVLYDWHELGYTASVPLGFFQQMKAMSAPTTVYRGHYQLQPQMTVADAIAKVVSGDALQYRVTIIEGSTLIDVAAALVANTYIDYDLPQVQSRRDYPALVAALGLDVDNPEGLFFADTYNFHAGFKASALLLAARQRMRNVLDAQWADRSNDLPFATPYEALIMASIIEKETALPEERARIAGVFVNRLRRKMRLETDPTVIYGLADEYDGNVTKKHLRAKTAYNTYRMHGLPPTPIASVGLASIHAALNPLEDGSLYFVGKGDGSHEFSATYEQHRRAVRKYQLRRRAGYRSTPQ